MTQELPIQSWSSVTVGVADMDTALDLWVRDFGMRVISERTGPAPSVAAVWGIAPAAITREVLLATEDAAVARLHLVEFAEPGPAVRDGANVFDLCPKNLDIYVRDMPARVAELRAQGRTFRNADYSEVTAPDGTVFREMHMPSHDAINVVLLEVLGADKPLTSKGYGAIGPLIYIVADAPREKAFVEQIFQFDLLTENILGGPEIEEMVGLPKGASLDVSIWGRADEGLGGLEIIDYRGVDSANLYPRTKAPATGILHVNFEVADLAPIIARLDAAGIDYRMHSATTTLFGNGRLITLSSPAGLRIELHERKL